MILRLFKKIFLLVIPPFLTKIVRKALLKQANYSVIAKNQDSSKIDVSGINYLDRNDIFFIDIHKIRLLGGIPLNTEENHFLGYYTKGEDFLKDFYNKFQPKDILSLHRLDQISSSTSFHLPWLHESVYKGEHGLNASHGHQAYGPISNKKFLLEKKRLDKVLLSINKHGFIYYPNDSIKGHFLISGDDWRFLVTGGKHRAAALAFLNWEVIPISFDLMLPSSINVNEINCWPQISKKKISKNDGLRIFKKYFT